MVSLPAPMSKAVPAACCGGREQLTGPPAARKAPGNSLASGSPGLPFPLRFRNPFRRTASSVTGGDGGTTVAAEGFNTETRRHGEDQQSGRGCTRIYAAGEGLPAELSYRS